MKDRVNKVDRTLFFIQEENRRRLEIVNAHIEQIERLVARYRPEYEKVAADLPSLSMEEVYKEIEREWMRQVVYKLKTAYQNGTTHIVLSPLDLLSRLASLVPRPRVHLIQFHGIFAPHFKYRSLIVPQPSLSDKTSHTEQKQSKQSYSIGWAKMLKRVFDIDIQTCLKCGGQIKIISSIHNPQIIKKILTHIGENSIVLKLSPPRGPPEGEESLVSI